MEATNPGGISIIMDTKKSNGGEEGMNPTEHLYKVFEIIPEENAKSTINLFLEKYCSVAKTPRSYVKIHYTFEWIP